MVDEVGRAVVRIEADIAGLKTGMDQARQELKNYENTVQTSTRTLLALGNVASSVDSIMSSYTNTQIRVENAELRVIEARQDLNKLTREGKTGTEEYESAVRRLEIAENNLERANNAVVGTYINMGVQILTLSTSLPGAIEGVKGLAMATGLLSGSTSALLITAAPWAALLTVIGVAGYEMAQTFREGEKEIREMEKAMQEFNRTGIYTAQIMDQISRGGSGGTISGDLPGMKRDFGRTDIDPALMTVFMRQLDAQERIASATELTAEQIAKGEGGIEINGQRVPLTAGELAHIRNLKSRDVRLRGGVGF